MVTSEMAQRRLARARETVLRANVELRQACEDLIGTILRTDPWAVELKLEAVQAAVASGYPLDAARLAKKFCHEEGVTVGEIGDLVALVPEGARCELD